MGNNTSGLPTSDHRLSANLHKAVSSSNSSSRSIRPNRRSLELPDLIGHSSYNNGRSRTSLNRSAPKTASIPIPIATGPEISQNRRRAEALSSQYGDITDTVLESVQTMTLTAVPEIQYDAFDAGMDNSLPSPPPPSRAQSSFAIHSAPQVIVRSTLPSPSRTAEEAGPFPVEIIWAGGGKEVLLARAGDDEWRGRTKMLKSTPSSPHSAIIWLTPGTHHLRFIADDEWRTAPDIPSTVDERGALTNYVEVQPDGKAHVRVVQGKNKNRTPHPTMVLPPPICPSTPKSATSTSKPAAKLANGASFWSTSSTVDGEEPPTRSIHSTRSDSRRAPGIWTTEIPLQLIEATRLEDEYLTALHSQEVRRHGNGPSVVNGFIPLPPIPPAPALPRHLDKLILNSRAPIPPPTPRPVKSGLPTSVTEISIPEADKAKNRPGKERRKSHSNSYDPHILTSGRPSVVRPDNIISVDDFSVLPVPSHVTLHHLTTSTIKNGVLAVGETQRYREKYITTTYYKPSDVS